MAVRVFALFTIAALTVASPAVARDAAPYGDFTECGDANSIASLRGTECARIEAPLNHSEPDEGTVELFV